MQLACHVGTEIPIGIGEASEVKVKNCCDLRLCAVDNVPHLGVLGQPFPSPFLTINEAFSDR
jgi:hypothetical protein